MVSGPHQLLHFGSGVPFPSLPWVLPCGLWAEPRGHFVVLQGRGWSVDSLEHLTVQWDP